VRLAATLLGCVLVLAGCGGSDGAPVSNGVTIDIAIKDGTVAPQGKRVEVRTGERVTLHITSDADEQVHVHSDPEHEYELAPGDDKTYTFSVDVPGQVAVEAHHLDVTIVQLVVRP
jgi:plastocyanin